MRKLKPASRENPCPICGRTKDGDCRISQELVLCHTHQRGEYVPDGWEFKRHSDESQGTGVYVIKRERWRKPVRASISKQWTYYYPDGRSVIFTRKPGKKGLWPTGTLPKELLPLYHDRLVLAAKEKQLVVWAEGETTADAAYKLGFVGTTLAGGASAQLNDASRLLFEPLVKAGLLVIAPDRDQAGQKLLNLAIATFPTIKVLYAQPESWEWQDLPPTGGYDLADWVDDGATRDQVLAAISDAPKTQEKQKQTEVAKDGKRTAADQVIDLVNSANTNLWSTSDGEAFIDIVEDGIRQTLPLRRKAFRLWLSKQYYLQENRSLSSEALQQAINTLEALAIYDGEKHDVHLRTATHKGRIYLDLCTPDWSAIEVSTEGWQIVSEPPVRFQRRDSMYPLVLPKPGGSLDMLRRFFSFEEPHWVMVISWLVNCFRPAPTYPVLILHGEAGSGKSTLSTLLKRIIDPGKAPLLPAIGDLRNLSVAANNRYLLVYDNLSGISAEQSDAICRIATGGGFSHRALYSDSEETIAEFTRPQILNGIDSLATRGDLLDRSILVKLSPPKKRVDSQQFWSDFEASQSEIFGAVLDLLVQGLRSLPSVQASNLPRMADFARFGVALEPALNLAPGKFLQIYQGVRDECHETVIESSPLAQAIVDLMADRTVWQGSATELLAELNNRVDETARKNKAWVTDGSRLTKQLIRLAPDLRGVGVDFDNYRSGGKRVVILEKIAGKPDSNQQSLPENGSATADSDSNASSCLEKKCLEW